MRWNSRGGRRISRWCNWCIPVACQSQKAWDWLYQEYWLSCLFHLHIFNCIRESINSMSRFPIYNRNEQRIWSNQNSFNGELQKGRSQFLFSTFFYASNETQRSDIDVQTAYLHPTQYTPAHIRSVNSLTQSVFSDASMVACTIFSLSLTLSHCADIFTNFFAIIRSKMFRFDNSFCWILPSFCMILFLSQH